MHFATIYPLNFEKQGKIMLSESKILSLLLGEKYG